MGIPGFTGEWSLIPTFTHYRGQYCHSLSTDAISSKASSFQPAVLMEIDGVPVGDITGIDFENGIFYWSPFGEGGGGGGGPAPPPRRCYTCIDARGGVSACCFAYPWEYFWEAPECFQMMERIRDQCIARGGSRQDCTREGLCAMCPCVEQTLGWEYCRCLFIG
jgi:hypothetical protein